MDCSKSDSIVVGALGVGWLQPVQCHEHVCVVEGMSACQPAQLIDQYPQVR